MKIAYIGNFEPEYSTENDVRKAFEHIGHEVIKLQENQVSIKDVRSAVFGGSDLLLITSTWDEALPLTDSIRLSPDVAVTGMLSLFKNMASFGIPSATLHLDTFWGTLRGGRKWWLNPMFHTAYIFTADGDYDKEWKLFGKNHIWLPPAVRHDACHFGTFRKEYDYDVGFAGSNGIGYHEDVWPYRRELVDKLRDMCKRNGWSFHNPGGDHPKVDRGEDMNDWYASVKVTVGDSLCLKKEDSKYWSDRIPEAWGRGGYLIMPRIHELQKQGYKQPVYEWGDWNDLEALIENVLNNPQPRKMLKIANQELVSNKHSYVNRVQSILETVGLT